MATISFDSVQLCKAAIEHCVDRVMKEDIAQGLKDAVRDGAIKNVYNAYPDPIFYQRWGFDGGLLDESLMTTDYGDHTLTLIQDVPWHNTGKFRRTTGAGTYDSLIDAVEKNGLYHAPPRPYFNEARDSYVAQKADSDMQKGLDSFGFGNF